MSEQQNNDMGYEYVTLVDRTGQGGTEIIHDGVRIVFKPGQVSRPVPMRLAEWLSRVDQHKVHTRTGEFVHRFGVREAPEEFLMRIGAMDASPIEIDSSAAEGWDTDTATERVPQSTQTIPLRRNPSDYVNVATPGQSFGGER